MGTLIWERCDGQQTIDQIATELAEEYDVPAEEAARDCQELMTPWCSKGCRNGVMPRVRHEVS